MSDTDGPGFIRRFGEAPEKDYFVLHQDLLRAPIPALEKVVLIDLLFRQMRGEIVPGAPQRAELFGVSRRTLVAAERELEAAGYLMIHRQSGRENLYLASSAPIPMSHPKRTEFALALAEYVRQMTPAIRAGVPQGAAAIGLQLAATPARNDAHPCTDCSTPLHGLQGSGATPARIAGVLDFDAGSPGSEVPPDPLLTSGPSPSSGTEYLSSSTSSSARGHACAHGEPLGLPPTGDPTEPPAEDELRLLKGDTPELAALRFFNSPVVQNALFAWHGISPSDRAIVRYRNALESYAERGIRVTTAQFQTAVDRALVWWRSEPRSASYPSGAESVLKELAALVMPPPTPSEKPTNGRREAPHSDRGPREYGRFGCRSGGVESTAGRAERGEQSAKIAKWRQGGPAVPPLGTGPEAEHYRDLD